jgi:quinol monooxygenase YgiN
MIIVAGMIYIKRGQRQKFLDRSMPAVRLARKTRGCMDFVVSADPIEKTRVNVFEMWASEKGLMEFRNSESGEDLFLLVDRADVSQYSIRKTI